MPHNIVIENEKYKKLNRNTFASYGSYEMVQAKLETHYSQKNWVTSNLLGEKMVQISANYEESLK